MQLNFTGGEPLCWSLVNTKILDVWWCWRWWGDPSVTVLSQLSLVAGCHAAGPSTSSPWHCLTMTGSPHHHHHCARALPTSRLTTHHTYTLLCSMPGLGCHHTNEWKQPVQYTGHWGIPGDTRGYQGTPGDNINICAQSWRSRIACVASVTGSYSPAVQ